MRPASNLWKEIDDAVVGGFVVHMDEITKESVQPHRRVYGTRIWFTSRIPLTIYENVVEHIRKNYDVLVEHPFPACIIIWEK